MVSPERIQALQLGWLRLVEPFGYAPAAAYGPFDRLVAAYEESHRRYHTLEHIAEMLRIVGKLRDGATRPDLIQLAVWYHDAIYDPTRSDNEARSAEFFQQELTVLPADRDVVSSMILATAHSAGAVSQDTAILLDADLAILGADAARYDRYATAIRAEYAHVPEAAWRTGRAAVLRQFRGRSPLYRTERMAAVGEAMAMANLDRELAGLESEER